MNSRQIHQDAGERIFAVVFEAGEEVVSNLLEFARSHRLKASSVSAIGGFSDVTLGYWRIEAKEYAHINLPEQVEVLSLMGNIVVSGDNPPEPKLHAHVVVGRYDGTTRGGHLLRAKVRPTLEVLVIESPKHLQRSYDAGSGLALLRV